MKNAFWVWDFRHIQEYYSPQNISTIKYLFMKNAFWVWDFRHIQEYYSPQNISTIKNIYSWKMFRKRKWQIPGEPLAARYNWCQGPAVEKLCDRETELLRSSQKSFVLSGVKKNFTDWNQFWHCTCIYMHVYSELIHIFIFLLYVLNTW